MSHANAALTPKARLRVGQLVVDQKVPIPEVAARFQCSYTTVKRWADRYAAGEPMTDLSSRPHTMPAKTPPATTKRIVSLRLRKRLGPVQLAAHVEGRTLDRAPGADPVPAQPVGARGPGHR